MRRDLNGPQKKKTRYHLVALGCLLILEFGLAASKNGGDAANNHRGNFIQIYLTLGQIVLIIVWIFLAVLVTAILGASKFIPLLYWMLVYWPLLATIAFFLFSGMEEDSELSMQETWLLVIFLIAEGVTLLGFTIVYYVYPSFVTSKWFRKTYGAGRNWRIRLLDDGMTMEYDGTWGRLGKRYQCHYSGETNERGMPHGLGVWSDDQYNGEILTGTWEDGHPIAPFSSRQYGTGDTFSAVRLAYFMATDDSFEASKLMPANDEPPRCGVAGVECSVAGNFMSHLPEASLPGEFQVEGEDDASIGKICKEQLHCGATSEDSGTTLLQINSNDPRGVQIGGHCFELTGRPFRGWRFNSTEWSLPTHLFLPEYPNLQSPPNL